MKRSRWAWVGAVLAVAGCSEVVGEGYDYGTIAVRATVGDSLPVANVRVEMYNWQRTLAVGTTDANGRYDFDFVPFGEVGVRSYAPPGHVATDHDGIVVPPGGRIEVPLNFYRPCCGVVRVRTQDDLGQPVPETGLVLYAATLTSIEAETGADGQHVFDELPEELYGVQIKPPAGYRLPTGSRNYVDGLTVSPSSDTTLVITLPRTASSAPSLLRN